MVIVTSGPPAGGRGLTRHHERIQEASLPTALSGDQP